MNRNVQYGVLAGVLAVAALTALITVFLAFANWSNIGNGEANERGVTLLSLIIVVVGMVQAAVLFGAMVAIAVNSYLNGERLSALYAPITAVKLFLSAVLIISGANALYLLGTDQRTSWQPILEPETRVLANSLFAGMVMSMGWLLVMLLRGRGAPLKLISCMFLVASVFVAALIAALVLIF